MKETTLADLAAEYDAFLVDQFGVLLNGRGPYPGAIEALSQLAVRGKKIVVLSNSGKRSGPNEARLVRQGFARDSFLSVISSGEAAHAALAGRIGNDIPPGAKVLVLSRDGDLSGIEGIDLQVTEEPDEAALVLLAGSRGEVVPMKRYAEMLTDPARRGVPCMCTNPDETMLTERGTAFGAGQIARLYRKLGGKVEYIGKPYPLIYEVADERLGRPDPAHVLCIGDSLAHDMRGGRTAGHPTALVRTGIHAEESLASLLAKCETSNDTPDFVIPGFKL